MVKVYETYIAPAYEKQRLTELRCDLCGEKAERPEHNNWTTDNWEVAETTVEMQTGVSYPESGTSHYTKFDICIRCFEDKLIPWVKGHVGADPRKSTIDF